MSPNLRAVNKVTLKNSNIKYIYIFNLANSYFILLIILKEAKIRSTVVLKKESFEILKMKQCLAKELDVNPDLAQTTRKNIDLEQAEVKKTIKTEENEDKIDKLFNKYSKPQGSSKKVSVIIPSNIKE